MTQPIFTDQSALVEVERLLLNRFRTAATISVDAPGHQDTNCHVVVAVGANQKDFSFQINGRPAQDVASELAKIVEQWMTANAKA